MANVLPRKVTVRFSDNDFKKINDARHALDESFQRVGSELFLKWSRESGGLDLKNIPRSGELQSDPNLVHNALSGLQPELERVTSPDIQSLLIAVLEKATSIFADLSQGRIQIEQSDRDSTEEMHRLETEVRAIRDAIDTFVGQSAAGADALSAGKKRGKTGVKTG